MPMLSTKEALAQFFRPVEFYTIKWQSKIAGFEYQIQTRDQYVQKYFKQGKINKIKTKEPEVIGLVNILNGDLSRAQRKLKGKNLCVCLMEMGKLDQALHIAKAENFFQAIKYIQSNQQSFANQIFGESKPINFDPAKTGENQSPTLSLKRESLSEKNQSIKLKGLVESSNTGSSQNSLVFDLPDNSETPFRPRAFEIMSRSASNFQRKTYLSQGHRPLSSQTPISLNHSAKTPILVSGPGKDASDSIEERSGPNFIKSSDSAPKILFPTMLKESQASQTLDFYKLPNTIQDVALKPNKVDSHHLSVGLQSTYRSKRKTPSLHSYKPKQVSDFKTEELLSSLVAQRLAGIERFKLMIGGQEKMEQYIAQYAEEWRSGKIRYQNTYKQVERPWSSKKQESAYDLSKTKFKEYKGTINLLVEDYLNRDEQPSEQLNQSKFKLNYDDKFDVTRSVQNHMQQSQTSGLFFEHKFSQTQFGFEQGPSIQESQKNVNHQSPILQSSTISKRDSLTEIEIPLELRERYLNALKTVRQGIVDPEINDLMSTQLTHQEIYDRSKAVRHLEKLLADEELLSANSEKLDENFWSRVQVVHKNVEKPDIFYIDEDMNEEILERLRTAAENNEDQVESKVEETNPPIPNLLKFLEQSTIGKQEQGQSELSNWFKRLYEEISVSKSLHMLLEQRYNFFKEERIAGESHGIEKPQTFAYSVLLTIREQFAIKQLQGSDVDYEMLGRMLSQNNYFSHFESTTRKKLILISQYVLLKQGEVLLHSDQLSDTIAVVISGAVSVHMCNKAKKNLRSYRNTLYPGESIGDAPLRLIIPADKISQVFFELKAAVDSDVLLIKKDDVPSILENEIRALMTSRIIPLQRCSLFSGAELQSPYSIFVLANLVQTKTFQIGDVIQQQGKQAEDMMYLVVRGFCKAVYQTTLVQLNRKKNEQLPKLKNSKESYGELGVLQQHLNSVKSFYVVKNIRSSIRQLVKKAQPGYLPKVKMVSKFDQQEKKSSGSTVMMFTTSSQELKRQSLLEEASDKLDEGDTLAHDQMNTTDSDDSKMTNRTQKLKDQEALVGHQRPKIIESTFKFVEPKQRVTQNKVLDVNSLKATSNNVHVLKSKLADKNVKTAKIDLIEHTSVIAEGQTFCSRALLDKQRCIKQLQNELNDYLEQLRIAEEERQKEFQKNSPYRSRKGLKSSLMGDQEIQTQMEENDNNLPEGIRPKQPEVKEPPNKKEQIGIQLDSDAFQKIFKQLRALLGDEQVKNKTAAELFTHLNQSQLTIVADSSDVLLLCIRRQDLSQLSEPVRRRIERDVLGQLFIDLDRPFTDKKDVNTFLSQHRQWQKFKLNTADSIIFNQ